LNKWFLNKWFLNKRLSFQVILTFAYSWMTNKLIQRKNRFSKTEKEGIKKVSFKFW
jgi:hypothetical protein